VFDLFKDVNRYMHKVKATHYEPDGEREKSFVDRRQVAIKWLDERIRRTI